MHQVDDPFRDGKSQPVALFIGIRVPAVKFFKDPFHRGVIHADAGIADGDTHLISCDNEFGRKHTASRGEFDGILQEIDPDLLQHLTVAVKFARRQINVEIQMLFLPERFQQKNRLPDLLVEAERRAAGHDLLLFQAGKQKNVAGHRGELARAVDDDARVFIPVRL